MLFLWAVQGTIQGLVVLAHLELDSSNASLSKNGMTALGGHQGTERFMRRGIKICYEIVTKSLLELSIAILKPGISGL